MTPFNLKKISHSEPKAKNLRILVYVCSCVLVYIRFPSVVIPSESMRSQSEAYWNREIYLPPAAGVRLKWNFPCLSRSLGCARDDSLGVHEDTLHTLSSHLRTEGWRPRTVFLQNEPILKISKIAVTSYSLMPNANCLSPVPQKKRTHFFCCNGGVFGENISC